MKRDAPVKLPFGHALCDGFWALLFSTTSVVLMRPSRFCKVRVVQRRSASMILKEEATSIFYGTPVNQQREATKTPRIEYTCVGILWYFSFGTRTLLRVVVHVAGLCLDTPQYHCEVCLMVGEIMTFPRSLIYRQSWLCRLTRAFTHCGVRKALSIS